MPAHDIHVIGTSAGGVPALKLLVADLEKDLPATVFVVLHTGPDSPGLLASVLQADCPLPVQNAEDGKPFERGRVYVAPPDRHLIVKPDQMCVTRGPKENRFRPAIDVLFRSAAWAL